MSSISRDGERSTAREDKYLKAINVQRTQHYLPHVRTSSTGVVQILDEISFWSNRAYQGLIQSKQRAGR